jgi:hypothetical protein
MCAGRAHDDCATRAISTGRRDTADNVEKTGHASGSKPPTQPARTIATILQAGRAWTPAADGDGSVRAEQTRTRDVAPRRADVSPWKYFALQQD